MTVEFWLLLLLLPSLAHLSLTLSAAILPFSLVSSLSAPFPSTFISLSLSSSSSAHVIISLASFSAAGHAAANNHIKLICSQLQQHCVRLLQRGTQANTGHTAASLNVSDQKAPNVKSGEQGGRTCLSNFSQALAQYSTRGSAS